MYDLKQIFKWFHIFITLVWSQTEYSFSFSCEDYVSYPDFLNVN